MEQTLDTIVTIGCFFGGWLGIWGIVAVPLGFKFGWRPFRPTPPTQKLLLLLPLYLLAPFVIKVANHLLSQTWQDQGLIWNIDSLIDGLWGWGIAIAGLVLVLIAKQRLGFISFSAEFPPKISMGSILNALGQQLPTVLGLVGLGILVGGIEELIFRGWLQTQLELSFSPWLAAIAASVLFALAHLIWDGKAGLWQQPGLWLLGIVLVVARWADGGAIAVAWGLHAGWVAGLAYIGEFIRPLPVADHPTWLTGRAEQPLTDIFDLTLLILTAILIVQLSGWWTLG